MTGEGEKNSLRRFAEYKVKCPVAYLGISDFSYLKHSKKFAAYFEAGQKEE